MPLDGLLVVDKPVGPTSHDVVSRARRILRERRIGHTGTLDPMASGVLLLVVGKATRLAQFLHADVKRYDATIRLGFATDTYDAVGRPTTEMHAGPMPTRDRIAAALAAFRGTFIQQPPAFSAKKIDGRRSYRLARPRRSTFSPSTAAQGRPEQSSKDGAEAGPLVLPAPVSVTVSKLDIAGIDGDLVQVSIACSTGFYVRSLAHDLGMALGVGGHLAALRRTEASGRALNDSVPLSAIEEPGGAERARQALIPLADVLPGLPELTLTPEGVRRAVTGCDLAVRDLAREASGTPSGTLPARARLLDGARNLVGIADLTPAGLLHPVVILM
jgi:tRNA pseudouridine55 synthase